MTAYSPHGGEEPQQKGGNVRLHAGHLPLLAVRPMLDGIFGSAQDRHIAA
jgi:hypothetical protein